jgi:hypothetical protein
VALPASPAAAVEPAGSWKTEVYPDEVLATVTSESGTTRLTLFCRTASKRTGHKLSTEAFEVRFDADPTQEFDALAKDFPALVGNLAGHRRMVMRAGSRMGQIADVGFSLDGGPAALKPLVEACGLPAELLEGPPAVARPAPAREAARERGVDGWQVSEDTSAFDDKPVVVVSGGSESGNPLYVRCREGALEAYVAVACVQGPYSDPVSVRVEFEDGTATSHGSNCSTDSRARFLLDAKAFIVEAGRHRTARLTYREHDRDRALTLKLEGLATALAPLRAACPVE